MKSTHLRNSLKSQRLDSMDFITDSLFAFWNPEISSAMQAASFLRTSSISFATRGIWERSFFKSSSLVFMIFRLKK
ncbi:MAG: hypothetical protein ACD_2C00246G0007 [uncultured bacterium (gcode 4)]|uniref:Uncharacterized protein n=1 Tax=uncultured bacterium (gcode 4) TaxID=1234023 RepID=K2GZS9_9BACT|nr:MAG: hypothetical protein ACD_2C00246G0007 [uncultured bacterium (gcode 4)]